MSDTSEVTREDLYQSLKNKGVTIEHYYDSNKMLLTRIVATYKGKKYDTGETINEHSYFVPTMLKAVGYFFTEPCFKQMILDNPELMQDYPIKFNNLIDKIK